MKEITFLLPEDSTELVTELVEKLGGRIGETDKGKLSGEAKNNIATSKRKSNNARPLLQKNSQLEKTVQKPQKKVSKSNKKPKKEKMDHTYLFGKWKDFDIDARKLREESW